MPSAILQSTIQRLQKLFKTCVYIPLSLFHSEFIIRLESPCPSSHPSVCLYTRLRSAFKYVITHVMACGNTNLCIYLVLIQKLTKILHLTYILCFWSVTGEEQHLGLFSPYGKCYATKLLLWHIFLPISGWIWHLFCT